MRGPRIYRADCQYPCHNPRSTCLVKSFNFKIINTLLGTFLRISNIETMRPSLVITATLIFSSSSSPMSEISRMLTARFREAFNPSPVTLLPSNVPDARPVITASKVGYWFESVSKAQTGLYVMTHLLRGDITNKLGVFSSLFFIVFGRRRKEIQPKARLHKVRKWVANTFDTDIVYAQFIVDIKI
jgi:hypothetical protein